MLALEQLILLIALLLAISWVSLNVADFLALNKTYMGMKENEAVGRALEHGLEVRVVRHDHKKYQADYALNRSDRINFEVDEGVVTSALRY